MVWEKQKHRMTNNDNKTPQQLAEEKKAQETAQVEAETKVEETAPVAEPAKS
jgi:hypothetical protein